MTHPSSESAFRCTGPTAYLVSVGLVTAGAVSIGYAMWFLPDERPLLLVLGAPLIIYLRMSRDFGLGLPLLAGTFLAYFAILLALPFLFGNASKTRFRRFLLGVILIHFGLGLAVTLAEHGARL